MPCWVEVVIGQGKSAMLCRTKEVVELSQGSGQVEGERQRGRHFLLDGVLRTVSGVHWVGLSFGGRDEAGRQVRSAPGFKVPSEGTITGSGLAVSLPSFDLRDLIL